MRIGFADPSTKLQTVHDLKRRARGGMVTSLFKVTDYLSRMGHDVEVFGGIETPGVTKAGTKWIPEPWGKYDALVCNRGTGEGYSMIDAKARILWTHDLPHSGHIPNPKTIKAFNFTVFMSAYAERVWRAFYNTIGRSVQIPNGVDDRIFYPRQKQSGYMIFASAPNRGLEKLPLILDAVSSRVEQPVILRAFSNLAEMHPNEGPDTFDYKSVEESNVQLRKPLPQSQFANELGKAELMVLPTGYPEICSNSILQALQSGTPVVTTGGLGSAPEWITSGRNGLLTRHGPWDYMIHSVEMVRHIVACYENPRWLREMQVGAVRTKVQNWNQIGAKWLRLLKRAVRFS